MRAIAHTTKDQKCYRDSKKANSGDREIKKTKKQKNYHHPGKKRKKKQKLVNLRNRNQNREKY